MCLSHFAQPLLIREVQGVALIDIHVIGARGEVVVGVKCLAQGQNRRFFHLPGSGIRTSDLSVTVPTLLTARLPGV